MNLLKLDLISNDNRHLFGYENLILPIQCRGVGFCVILSNFASIECRDDCRKSRCETSMIKQLWMTRRWNWRKSIATSHRMRVGGEVWIKSVESSINAFRFNMLAAKKYLVVYLSTHFVCHPAPSSSRDCRTHRWPKWPCNHQHPKAFSPAGKAWNHRAPTVHRQTRKLKSKRIFANEISNDFNWLPFTSGPSEALAHDVLHILVLGANVISEVFNVSHIQVVFPSQILWKEFSREHTSTYNYLTQP